MQQYGAATIEDAINSFRGDFNILLTEEGMVNITVRQKTEYFHPDENELNTRQNVQNIAQFIIDYLDQKYTELETQKARYQRIIIERRYEENLKDIAELEQRMVDFSTEFGIFDVELQTQAQLETIYQLQTELLSAEIQYEILQANFDNSNMKVLAQKNIVNTIESKIDEIVTGEANLSMQTTLNDLPEISRQYIQLQRELAVQSAIYEFVNQQYEQIKVQEAKDTPSLQFIDTPQLPTKRTSPRRALMVIAICAIGFFVVVSIVTIIEFFERNSTLLMRNSSVK